MENDKKTGENGNIDETGNVGTQANQNKNEGAETNKTFSQDEVNALLRKEKEKYSKKIPDSETYKAFQKWQEDQKTEAQKNAEREAELTKAQKNNTELEQLVSILKQGVNKDDADYVQFKVSKMEGDFGTNLSKFLKDNPKYLGASETKIVKKVGSSVNLDGKSQTNQNETNQKMNDLIRSQFE